MPRRKLIKQIGRWAGVAALLVIVGFLVRGDLRLWQKEQATAASEAVLERLAAALQSEQAALTANINQLATPSGVEAELKQKYGVVSAGEQLAVVVATGAPTSTPTPTPNLWQQFLNIF